MNFVLKLLRSVFFATAFATVLAVIVREGLDSRKRPVLEYRLVAKMQIPLHLGGKEYPQFTEIYEFKNTGKMVANNVLVEMLLPSQGELISFARKAGRTVKKTQPESFPDNAIVARVRDQVLVYSQALTASWAGAFALNPCNTIGSRREIDFLKDANYLVEQTNSIQIISCLSRFFAGDTGTIVLRSTLSFLSPKKISFTSDEVKGIVWQKASHFPSWRILSMLLATVVIAEAITIFVLKRRAFKVKKQC